MKPGDIDDAGLINVAFLEQLYQNYTKDPSSVDPSWRHLFDEEGGGVPAYTPPTKPKETVSTPSETVRTVYTSTVSDDGRVLKLIEAYRTYGHLMADVNPIRASEITIPYELSLATIGFSKDDLNKQFVTYGLLEDAKASLSTIIAALEETYCGKIGVEYMGLQRRDIESWLQEKIEKNRFKVSLSMEQKQMILQHLNKSELFESFLHTKYVGQKRFSLEGGETLIPILAAVIDNSADHDVDEIVFGMAHRGRLNVLANIMNKSYTDIFGEFDDSFVPESVEGGGDVKYHKGHKETVTTYKGKKIKIGLASNPSHLEAVNAVVEGVVRARQVLIDDDIDKKRVIPVLIHGDASIAGQGVIYEVMQMSKLPGYDNGGTVHIVVNNQIGFTTLPKDSRSTRYCTDIARTFGAPVFHVNGEDPEACVFATNLAMEIRHHFQCDVFIDLNCFRKFGHNEGDEPAFTQPLEYQLIRKKKPVREIYRDALIHQGVLEKYMAESLEEKFNKALDHALKGAKVLKSEPVLQVDFEDRNAKINETLFRSYETGVKLETLQEIARLGHKIPDGFVLNKKLHRLVKQRLKMAETPPENSPMDWGMAEMLAFGSLLWEGKHVRLSGQDSRRGTFSHRHAMWLDQETATKHFPLCSLKKDQGRFDVFNSPLSEYGVLGFDYGYTLGNPDAFVVWEAQFGDFCNGAQIIIDQFIATAEQKWSSHSRLALFLPHGYEGQGPEHSSARVERFLGLCGKFNMQVCNVTTPAQLFHLIRRQALRPIRKPLVLFTPKGLLRHPACVSPITDLTEGSFQEILDDPNPPQNAKRLVICTGRIYYDLLEGRLKNKADDMAIIRIEQLYPFGFNKLSQIIEKYPNIEKCFWVQEEPSNMGAWKYIHPRLTEVLPTHVKAQYIGRPPNASPATGSHNAFKKQHSNMMNAVFKSEAQPFYEISYDRKA
jgi:2-oxoglutarate dehydrogenase E1 component